MKRLLFSGMKRHSVSTGLTHLHRSKSPSCELECSTATSVIASSSQEVPTTIPNLDLVLDQLCASEANYVDPLKRWFIVFSNPSIRNSTSTRSVPSSWK